MEKLTVLGTGNSRVIHCYNTCFTLHTEQGALLTDTGGGNGILVQLDKAGIDMNDIHHLFLTHEHCDHMLGAIWIIRRVGTLILRGQYDGTLTIYGGGEVLSRLSAIASLTLQPKYTHFIGEQIILQPVHDEQQLSILGRTFTFFDLRSENSLQYGYSVQLHCGKLTFTGDEPCPPWCEHYVQHSRWYLCEAFCCFEDREVFHPYRKFHKTARDAAELAQRLDAKNLVLWHTEDNDLAGRREQYTREAREVFTGGIYVPDDLDVIALT